MAQLSGYGQAMYIAPDDGAIGIGGPSPVTGTTPSLVTVDGTPTRVCVMALAAAAGLWALKLSGIRFNVGVAN